MKAILVSIFIVVAAMVGSAGADLTGRWSCDDGGAYYLRQTGRQLCWYAETDPDGPVWATVFCGRIYDKRIKGRWADVPKGRTSGSGDVELAIENHGNTLRVVKTTSGYRGTRWDRRDPGASAPRALERLRPSDENDCVRFDPLAIRVRQAHGRWRLIDGEHWLFDFGKRQAEARQALAIIRQHRFTHSCRVGRPSADFTYLRR